MADKRISQLVERTDIANNDVVPIVASGATTTNKATISSIQEFMQENLDLGVTSVGITLGTTGTDVNVTGSPITTSGNITINIPDASATARGVVSTGTQTFAGNKTLLRNINVNGVYVGRGASGGDLFSGIAGNTSVGSSALISITTGFPNTALGSEALRNITTGANNIAIGSDAGKLDAGSGAANATSSSSIYIGNSTKPQTNGNTNEIVIGHASSGNGSNTTTIGNSSTTFNRFFGATLSDSFRLPSDGGGNQVTVFENIGTIHTGSAGSNIFGFNNSNNIFFGKGLSNGGVIQWTNAAVRYYTLPDADGTIALTSDLTGYVTLGTVQTITGQKTFNSTIVGQDATLTSSGSNPTLLVTHSSGSGIALDISKGGNGEGLRVTKTSGSGNAVTITGGALSAVAGQFSGDLQSSTRVIAAVSGESIVLTPNLSSTSNRIESAGTLPLALVSAAAITMAAGGTTPQITLSTGGNVGIGTSNPLLNLQINSATGSNSTIAFSENNTLKYYTRYNAGDGSYQIIDVPNSSARLTISSTGAATFSDSVTATTGLTVGSLGSGSNAIITLANNASGSPRTIYYKASDATINFTGTGGTDQVTITNGGNVGIGTASISSFYGFARTLSVEDASSAEIQLKATGGTNTLASFGAATTGTFIQSATQPLITVVNGAERMRITSGGAVAIGATSTNGRLGVRGTTNDSSAFAFEAANSSGNTLFIVRNDGAATFEGTIFGKNNAVFQNTSTNIVNIGSDQAMYGGSNSDGGLFVYGNNKLHLSTNSVRRLTIDGSGNVGIGTASPGVSLEVNGLIRSIPIYNNTTATLANLVVSAGGTFERSTTSSGRYKDNITDWNDSGLETILSLKPKQFTYKEDYYSFPDRKFLGLIAEDVEQVSTYLVDFENEDGSGQVENVRYANIVVPLIKAIQELKAEIDSLKTK